MSHAVRLLWALVLTLALAVTVGFVASSQARRMQWFTCGQVKLRTAPWAIGIQQTIGVGISRGTRYWLRVGGPGPSCAVARNKLAHIATLRTRKAIRAASFGGFHCDVARRYAPDVLWVRPLGAWAGCWTAEKQAPAGRYFFWELISRP